MSISVHLKRMASFWKWESLKINISSNRRGMGKHNSHYFINDNSNSTSKNDYFLGKISLRELIMDNNKVCKRPRL